MNPNPQPENSIWKQITAIILASIVLITFVVFLFYPPQFTDATLPIIRFLAACFGGLAAFLFVGELNLEGTLPMNKLTIKAAGGFATFVLVFFLFLWGIESSETNNDSSEEQSPILSQAITLFNPYPIFSLFNPNQPQTPDILVEELDLEKNPIIFQRSPVFNSIQKFIIETENKDYIPNINLGIESGEVSQDYSFNQQGLTQSSTLSNEEFVQNSSEFEKFSLVHELSSSYNTPVVLEFKTDLEDAPWTAIQSEGINTLSSGILIQYPKLSELVNSERTFANFNPNFETEEQKNPWLSRRNAWLKQVIQTNPEKRGLVGYKYPYISNLSDSSLIEECSQTLRSITSEYFSPYVKLIDILNPSSSAIQLNSITYEIYGETQSQYRLTNFDKRSSLFQNAATQTIPLGVILQPKRHYFIPIEFGFVPQFDRREELREKIVVNQLLPDPTIYLPKRLENRSQEQSIDSYSLDRTSKEYRELIQKYNQKNTQKITFPDAFIQRIKLSRNQIPLSKLAIGSILNPVSIQVNNQDVQIPPPADEVSSSIANVLGFGSCPYLLVYDSDKGFWIDVGPVLYARSNKNLQDTELHNLSKNITKIKLLEREQEITHLDSLSLIYTDSENNTTHEIKLSKPKLNQVDHQYMDLHQGESVEIDLETLIPPNASNIQLKVNGYYEII